MYDGYTTGLLGAGTGWWGTDVYLHNTLNVVGDIHFVLLMGGVLLRIGLIYWVVADLTKKRLSKSLGIIHLAATIIGGFGLAFTFTYVSLLGVIRREVVLPDQFIWAMP